LFQKCLVAAKDCKSKNEIIFFVLEFVLFSIFPNVTLNGSSFLCLYIGTCEMDVVFNYLSDFAYDTETYEVESMEEHLISS